MREILNLLNRHQEIIEAGDRLHDRQDIYNIRTRDFFTVETLIEAVKIILNFSSVTNGRAKILLRLQ
jgi:hypothetical protein